MVFQNAKVFFKIHECWPRHPSQTAGWVASYQFRATPVIPLGYDLFLHFLSYRNTHKVVKVVHRLHSAMEAAMIAR